MVAVCVNLVILGQDVRVLVRPDIMVWVVPTHVHAVQMDSWTVTELPEFVSAVPVGREDHVTFHVTKDHGV